MEIAPSPPTLRAALEGRRSVHTFDAARIVPQSVLENALRLAVCAPNHKRTEPWRFYVAGPDAHARIVALNTDLVRARSGDEAASKKQARWQAIPGFVVVTCRQSGDALRAREDYAACACAVQNLMLALWADGVGTKWTTGPVTRDARFFDLLGADAETETVVGLVHYGYPADVPTTPRPAAENVTFWLP